MLLYVFKLFTFELGLCCLDVSLGRCVSLREEEDEGLVIKSLRITQYLHNNRRVVLNTL